ncbi:unnamed protein product [Urochloa humidicola]
MDAVPAVSSRDRTHSCMRRGERAVVIALLRQCMSSSWTHRHASSSGNNTTTSSPPPFPGPQPMAVYSSIWNADDWATQGGRVKTDWSHAPFEATFREVRVEGCAWAGNATDSDAGEVARCTGSSWGKEGRYWWKEKEMSELSVHQSHQLVWARAHHLVYDYCVDTDRFPVQPPECAGR